jgi:hypothetical protein
VCWRPDDGCFGRVDGVAGVAMRKGEQGMPKYSFVDVLDDVRQAMHKAQSCKTLDGHHAERCNSSLSDAMLQLLIGMGYYAYDAETVRLRLLNTDTATAEVLSQFRLCGWQIEYGTATPRNCRDLAQTGQAWCATHMQEAAEDYPHISYVMKEQKPDGENQVLRRPVGRD